MPRIKLKQVDGIRRTTASYALDAFLRHCQLKNLSPYSLRYETLYEHVLYREFHDYEWEYYGHFFKLLISYGGGSDDGCAKKP